MDKAVVGQVFSEHFGFSCQFSFHRLLHSHYLSSDAGTQGQLVANVPSGLSLTQPQETKRKNYLIKEERHAESHVQNLLAHDDVQLDIMPSAYRKFANCISKKCL
jgi:hypothetical protein